MSRPVNELQQLVLRRLAELGEPGRPLSIRSAADRSLGKIGHESLRKIARGLHTGELRDITAEGLAMALDVPLSEIYRVARIPQPMSRWVLPQRFDRIPANVRQQFEELMASHLEAYERGLNDPR